MSTAPKRLLTPDEYLAIERDAPTKHEFYRGEMFAMAGASRRHNQITFNIVGLLHGQLQNRDWFAYSADMRVHVPATTLFTYPDAVITCNEPEFVDDQFDTLLNPQVVIEVVSDSTEAYDRGKKFKQYMQLESLRDYLLVAQNYAAIDHYHRDDAGNWTVRVISDLDAALEIATVGCTLRLADVYAKVDFPPEDEVNRKAGLLRADGA